MTDLARRIAGLSPERQALLLRQLAASPAPTLPPLTLPPLVPRPEDRFRSFPLTDIQEVYWVGRSGWLDLSTPGANVYLEYQIEGQVDTFLDRFEEALERTIDRHEILRLVVQPDGRQRFLEQVEPIRVERIDLRGLGPAETQRRLDDLREHYRYHEGPTGSWPLFGLTAHRLEDGVALLHVWMDCWLIDGLSRDRLVRDLFQVFYQPDAPLPPLECTYRDYALARQEHRSTEIYRRSRDWWLQRIPTLAPPPELPLARPLSPLLRLRFQHEFIRVLEPEAWQRLKERAARHQLTPSTPLVAAFVEVVRAWSRRPRFTLSVEGSYWPSIHPQIRELVGNFNTIYIVQADDLEGTFADRAFRLQGQLSEVLGHRAFSGFEVLREIRRRQGGGTRSLMPVLFNSLVEYAHESYQDPAPPEGTSEARIVQREIGGHPPQLLMMPSVFEGPDGSLVCKFQIVTDAFPRGFVPALRDAFIQLLRRLADEEEVWGEARLELAHPMQLAQRQPAFHPFPPPEEATLCSLMAVQATVRPDQVAVLGPGLSLTYRELLERAERLARRLRTAGVRPDRPVALALDRGWQQAVAILGALMSGACILPVASTEPADRLGARLRRYGVRLAVARAGLELPWPDDVRCLALEEEPEKDLPLDILPPMPENLAFVVENDEGQGVMIDHGAASRAVTALRQRLGLGSADRVLSLAPPASDLALFEVLGPLAAGGAVLLPAAGEETPEAWSGLAFGAQATVWSGTPLLLERMIARAPDRQAPETLRLIVLTRGTVPVTLPGRLRTLSGGVRIVCLGGVPEAAFASTAHASWTVPAEAVRIPAGRPFNPCTAHVLDHTLTPRPDLVTGELWLGGPTLARGYWENDELTRARFLVHPRTGERLFRTGLLGRFLDGTLEILGTEEEHGVDLLGSPADPRWTEASLERQPEIRVAAVRPWNDGRRQRLAAYVVLRPGTAPDWTGIAGRLGLPAALLPERWVALDELPLRADGTLDRAALGAPQESAPRGPSPSGPLEDELTDLWSGLLPARPESVTDDFFELGGDSFSAVLLLGRIRERFGHDVELASFFLDPTVRCLATAIRQASGDGGPSMEERSR